MARAPSAAAGEEGSPTSPRPASILLIALAATVTRARAADEAVEDLGEVVVTAPAPTRRAAPRDPTASATIIDTRSAPTQVETLDEALSDAVGVQVRRFGGLGDFSTVSIRGYGAGQVQVYLDGVPLGRADNEVVNLADLPLDAVDHIEVYRGSSPLAFAQSGPGGVVNIVTREPGTAPLLGASASYGSFDTRKANLAVGGSRGPVSALAFAHYLGSEGDFRFTNDVTPRNPFDDRSEKRRNNAFDLGDLTTRLGYHAADPLTLTLTTESFVKEQGIPGGVAVHLEDAHLGTTRQLANLEAALANPAALPLEVHASGWSVYQRRDLDIPISERHFVPTDRTEQSVTAGGQVLARGALGAHQLPGALLAIGHERFSERDRLSAGPEVPDRTRLRGSVAGEDEVLLFNERLSLVPGLRWEIVRDEFPGSLGPGTTDAGGQTVRDFLSPRFGVRVEALPGLDLLGNIGRYARIPNLQELFGNSGFLKGNPNLETEKAQNRDLGFRARLPPWRFVSNATLEYSWFDNQIDDLIVFVQQSQTIVRPENVGAASLSGHEVAVSARFWDRLGLVGNYTHQRTRDESDRARDRRFRGNQLPGRPADEAYARVELGWSAEHPLPLGSWTRHLWPGRLYYDVNLISDNFLDRANNQFKFVKSRTLHGIGLDLGLPVAGLRLGLEMKNAGDERTEDVFGFPLPGRAMFATLSYGFGEARAAR